MSAGNVGSCSVCGEPIDNRQRYIKENAGTLFCSDECWRGESVPTMKRELLAARKVVEAAREAAEGRGRFSRDPLTHADNCIEDMKGVLNAALAAYDAATKGE